MTNCHHYVRIIYVRESETDSPYLTPEPHRGKRNEPKYVKFTAEKVAELKEMELNDLIYNTNSNVRNLFSIED